MPDVNETHYLTKAKHYWNPSWCPGDLVSRFARRSPGFLLDLRLADFACSACRPRPGAAGWSTWGLLAWAWRRLSFALVPRPFLLGPVRGAVGRPRTSRLHMAGEWLIGGFEAKGLAYVFVLLALTAHWPTAAGERSGRCWALPRAFHVLGGRMVGAWPRRGLARRRARRPASLGADRWTRAGHRVAAGLPGLIAASGLNWGVDPATVGEANRIYVFKRLPHHLLPQAFTCPFGLSPDPAGRRLVILAAA